MTRLALAVALALALLGAAYGAGWHMGRVAMQGRLDAAAVASAAASVETTRALAMAEQTRRQLSQALEDDANAQPVSAPQCLPVERVKRLNLR